jgi:MATE family multidrug resistance protein
MVGRVSAEAIGAVGVGSSIFMFVGLAGIGMLLGLDHVVSYAYGAGDLEECHRSLLHGVYVSFLLGVPLTAVCWLSVTSLPWWGIHEDVLSLAAPYIKVVSWSILPLLLYATFRRYLQAMGSVKPIMVALVTANVVNLLVDWVLVFGRFGVPALGPTGAAYATFGSQLYMALGLIAYVVFKESRRSTGLFVAPRRIEAARIRKLLVLGGPASIQLILEVGVFATATLLAARLSAASLAAHQIVLKVASFSFMIPLGISAAGAVPVGQALGRNHALAAAHSGWTALLLGAGFMVCAGASFLLFPYQILRAFTTDHTVIAVGITLLAVAAVFQLFDGIQVVTTGTLRGAGDTRTPMILNFAGHWVLGLPIGYLLCFSVGWGVRGLWIGLCAGLMAVGSGLLYAWFRLARRFSAEPRSEALFVHAVEP